MGDIRGFEQGRGAAHSSINERAEEAGNLRGPSLAIGLFRAIDTLSNGQSTNRTQLPPGSPAGGEWLHLPDWAL